jgi:hypothetical protein
VPTDILLAIEKRHLARKKAVADLRFFLVLVPTIACLISILLAMESDAYAGALSMIGMN